MNVFAFRIPGSKQYDKIVSDRISLFNPDDDSSGFIIYPFFGEGGILKISEGTRVSKIPSSIVRDNKCEVPEGICTEEAHRRYIEAVIKTIGHDETKKIVAARTFSVKNMIDPDMLFNQLCTAYPDAFVFFLSTPQLGSWIGASPELLLKRDGDKWETMALAGTRPAGTIGDWDEKNIQEQKIVTHYIKDIFQRHGLTLLKEESDTKQAGPVEHIHTRIKAISAPKDGLTKLLTDLSPTPALCGMPKRESMEMIHTWEGGSRSLYGGFIGWYENPKNFSLYVNLRSALISPEEVRLYAGGGITWLSDPSKEWEETQRKLSTLLPYVAPSS